MLLLRTKHIFEINRFVIISLLLSLSFVLTACGGGGGTGDNNDTEVITGPLPGAGAILTSIDVLPDDVVLKVGSSHQMSAVGNYDDGGQLNISNSVTWAATSASDITLNSSGLVTAVSVGSDIVTAINATPAVQGFTFVYTSTYGVEGNVGSPAALTLETPHSGEVNFGGPGTGNGYSYYAVNVTPGGAYYIFLTGLDGDAHLEVFDDSSFSNQVCASQNSGTVDEICYADGPANGVLYIAVNGDETIFDLHQGAAYTLTVNAGYKYEGPESSPIPVTLDTPLQGQVGRYVPNVNMLGSSIYSVPLALTGRYTISITNPTANVAFSVLDGAGSGVILCFPTAETCSLQAEDSPVYIHVVSVDTIAGAGFTLTVTEDHEAYTVEGTATAPLALTTLPHHGQVGGISGWTNSYYSIPVTALQSVKIQAANLDGSLSMYVYDGDATFTNVSCSAAALTNSSEVSCSLEPAMTGTVYVKISSSSSIGTEYFLNVIPINYIAQGTSVTPQLLVSVPDWQTPYTGEVDASSSYYQVPVNAGKLYRIGLADVSGDVSLSVYDDAGLSNLLCSSNVSGLTDESCQTTPGGSDIWVVVGGDIYGSKFNLTVDRVYVQQGAEASPLDISASLPTYTGGETGPGTGDTERTHLIATLTAGKAYTFEATNHTDTDLSIWVYDNATFNYPNACALEAYNNFSCTIVPLYSGTAAIRVTSYDPYGSSFDLTVTETVFETQGTAVAPVNIGLFPVVGSVGVSKLDYTGGRVDGTNSYYVADISGGYAYVNYAVGLVNQSADVDLYVYDDVNFTNLLCSSVAAGTSNETCAGLNPVGSNIYIRVSGASSGFGGTFDLTVDHDYSIEGAVSTGNGGSLVINSVALTQGVAYQGQAQGFNHSYYYLPSFTPGTYTITISNMFDSACVWIYDEADGKFNTLAVDNDTNNGITPDKSFSRNFANGLFIEIRGCGSTVTGTAFTVIIN